VAEMKMQLGQVIDKLLEKTKLGKQKWSPSLMANRYQARFGDFAVEISGIPVGSPASISSIMSGGDASIRITRLDGTVVAEAGGGAYRSVVAKIGGSSELEVASQNSLNNLYSLVANRSRDLDELLDLI
jgi:hypothetical protein